MTILTTVRRFGHVAVACAACFAALGLTPSSRSASQGRESWYDADHGWRVVEGFVIDESNDGGATWRRLPNPHDSQVGTVLRTGVASGVYEDSFDDRMYWTNDGGRHWSYSPRIGQPLTGSGRFLFWWQGRWVYRVRPWPAPYRCTVYLRSVRCGYRDRRGRIREGTLTATKVASVPEGNLDASVIPGGVVAATVALSAGIRPYAVVARWIGRGSQPKVISRELPHPSDRTLSACRAPLVDWPTIVVPACEFGGRKGVGLWSTDDGGKVWRFSGT